jgi:putative acetyltransferase
MIIRRISPNDPAAQKLIADSDQLMQSLYPAESNHLESVQSLMAANVAFFGCFIGSELAGCGAVKILDDDDSYGEIKKLYVSKENRGKGISLALMAQLEASLAASGIKLCRLETGIRQPEALGLYKKLAYVVRGPFGSYGIDPLSVFMEKKLQG